ncbi:MAG TPA: hypothetical protein VL381_01555 [Rhodocyclaceae bacterium]|jgi:hypothetical protein|nr:hypothetical protein [Rhodocyclaceae bacterium]
MENLDWVQWPAMCVTLLAAWLTTSNQRWRRHSGFWLFLLSNFLWIAWSIPAHAYALIVLQVGLATLNILGVFKTEMDASKQA